MDREGIIRFVYDIIKCKGKSPDCLGKDCYLCVSEKIADYIECK